MANLINTKASRKWTGLIGSGGVADASVTTVPIASATGLTNGATYYFTIDRVDSSGVKTPTLEELVKGTLSGTNFINCTRGVGGTAQAHAAGKVVEILNVASQWNDLTTGLAVEHNEDGTHKGALVTTLKATGAEVTAGTEDAKIVTPKAIADAGITATPVKATGAEVTTGTNDTKFVTPKAMADAGVNLPTALSSKVFYISKDMTAASGDVSYTGIGFKPTAMIAFSAKGGTTNSHMGMVDSSKTGRSIYNLAGNFSKFDAFIVLTTSSGNYQEAAVKSFDTDGFTLTWAKTGSPTGTGDIIILCFK